MQTNHVIETQKKQKYTRPAERCVADLFENVINPLGLVNGDDKIFYFIFSQFFLNYILNKDIFFYKIIKLFYKRSFI